MELKIGRKDGILKEVRNAKGVLPLTNGPVLAADAYQVSGVSHEENAGVHKVLLSYEKNRMQMVWTISPNGLVDLDIKYQPKGSSVYCGVDFSLPEAEVTQLRWMGNGPYGVWKNRLKGVGFNVWEKAYNNTVTGSSGFVYPEFKGYHASLYWAEIGLKNGQSFRVYCKTPDVFLKLFNPVIGPKPENTLVNHSKGDLSFLNGIPAIGNKFSGPDALGPESKNYQFESKRVLGGYLNIDLVFDFVNP